MRRLRVVILSIVFLLALPASTLFAQNNNKQYKTGSAKAAYGYPTESYRTKKKAKKNKKKKKSKQPKSRNKNGEPLYRKKSPWVN